MKNLKKRILSFLLVTAMLLTCIPVFAVESDSEIAVGTTFSLDLTIDKPVSDNFRMAGVNTADGQLVEIDPTQKPIWGTWPGYWTQGDNPHPVFGKTENTYAPYAILFDMMSRDGCMPALVFTAPADGVYDVYFKGLKYQGGTAGAYINVYLMKGGDDNPLSAEYDVEQANGDGQVVLEVKNIALSAGDEIMVLTELGVMNFRNGGANFGVQKFDVTYKATEGGNARGDRVAGSTYKFDLTINNKKSDHFQIAAIKEDGTFDYLRYYSEQGWSAAWYCWNTTTLSTPLRMFYDTQVAEKGTSLDFTPKIGVDSAVIFTAPVSGVYSFTSKFTKTNIYNAPTGYALEVVSGGEQIKYHAFKDGVTVGAQTVNLDASDIVLNKGETIMFIASQISGDVNNNPEIGILNLEVNLDEVYDEPSKGVVIRHVSDISLDKPVSGPFAVYGLRLEDGVLVPVEDKPAPTWSAEYPGNWIVGSDHSITPRTNVTQKVEQGEEWPFYMVAPQGDVYASVVAFEAPADGYFSALAILQKKYAGTVEVALMKDDGTVIKTVSATLEANGIIDSDIRRPLFVENLWLNAGEKLLVVVYSATEGNGNVGFVSYAVEGHYADCPHDYNGDDTCEACGYVCEAHEWVNGECYFCDTVCAHNWDNGACTTCGIAHEGHEWANENGTCTVCGKGHTHEGGEAVCNKGAVCTTCGYEYTEADADNHDWSDKTGVCGNCGEGCTHAWENGVCTTCGYECVHDNFSASTNGDGTHDYVCNICGSAFITGATCKPVPEGTECECGYDCSAMIAEDNFGEVFDSIYNGGESEYVANGPAAGALDNVGAVKGTDVDGFKYMGFNLEMSADKNTFYLRHHVLLSGDLAVKVGEADAALTFVSGNYCYFDVEVKIGEFGVNHTITVDGTAVVTASVYSYMKTALESGELTTEQTNLLKALYDWDYAVANAN